MGSLTATLGQLHVLPAESWGAVIGGVVGGAIGSYLGGRFLMSYTETASERADVRRFLYLNIITGMFWCLAILLAVMLQAPVWAQLTVLAVGLGVVNYQCLVPLQRVMAPMIARDSARRGRSGTNWKYESMYGRTGIIAMNLMVIALVVYSLMRSGRL